MRRSLESSRPILSKNRDQQAKSRATTRYSTYSNTPSEAYTEKSTGATSMASSNTTDDSHVTEIQRYSKGLDRLDSKRLQEQRYSVSEEKTDDMSKLALGAKVQRALDRRYSGQDAEWRPKPKPNAKTPLNEKAAPDKKSR